MEGVYTSTGSAPGVCVAVFGGVHGNERPGIQVVEESSGMQIDAGTLHLVLANPLAALQGVRQIGKNLNRAFVAGNSGTTPEDVRARELMTLLDSCDALLDLHASNSTTTIPFAITEPAGFLLARRLPVPIISSGWDSIEPGAADGYMHRHGKVGVCVEAGSVHDSDEPLRIARDAFRTFLLHYGLLVGEEVPINIAQRHVAVHRLHRRQSEHWVLKKEYADFEPLVAGEVFAEDGNDTLVAAQGECIVFARQGAPIGSEAFVLGREQSF